MANFGQYCTTKDDDGVITELAESSKASDLSSRATSLTLNSRSFSRTSLGDSSLDFNFASIKSMGGLIDPEFAESSDGSGLNLYANDDDQDDHDFEDTSTEFGDFSVSPAPGKVMELVEQFTKVIEEEERFVKMYEKNFQSDPDNIRKALVEKGFKFKRAKMVRMLSSRALRAEIIEEDAEYEEKYDARDNDELYTNPTKPSHDDCDSVCTNQTGSTGYSQATNDSAAHLMNRLKDPNDHDSVLSKELRQLSPEELATRFVEMQEKLARKQKKKDKKKKKKKKKEKREEEERRESLNIEGPAGLPKLKNDTRSSVNSYESAKQPTSILDKPPAEEQRFVNLDESYSDYQQKPKPVLKNSSNGGTVRYPPPSNHNSANHRGACEKEVKKPFWKKILKSPFSKGDGPRPTLSGSIVGSSGDVSTVISNGEEVNT